MNLFGAPRRPAFDQHTLKFAVGAIAFSLPWIEMILTKGSITSISESFWSNDGPWPRNIFVGFLFSIATLLLAYNGNDELEMWLGKIASACAIGIAMFPCKCQNPDHEIIPHVHLASATTMFATLGAFCVVFWRDAKRKGHLEAHRRMVVYSACCLGMLVTIAIFVAHAITRKEILVLYGETLGLGSFGVSWMTASHMLPFFTHPSERKKLFART